MEQLRYLTVGPACSIGWDGVGQSSLASIVQLGIMQARTGKGGTLGTSPSGSSSVCLRWEVRGQKGWA